jgi:formylglycine-generating enzyme
MTAETDGMLWIAAGSFHMGSGEFYREEKPVHEVQIDGFWIDVSPVTHAQFAAFVEDTGYLTVAERDLDGNDYPGVNAADLAAGSLVFTPSPGPVPLNNPGNWWRFVKGANWRRPDGVTNTSAYDHPVVQVAFEDVQAYAEWTGKALPSEAEWEYAAQGGQVTTYPWGDELQPDGIAMANTWEGSFPWQNTGQHSQTRTSPVGSYPANNFGLYDMVGNVWEWTQDWWRGTHATGCCVPQNPRGGDMAESLDPDMPNINIPRKVLKGGSHLCAADYCLRYRPAARIPQMIDSGTTHIGFRCIRR